MRMRLLAVAVAVVLPLVTGCATRGDIRDLQSDLRQMQAQQERLIRELQRQNDMILDSLQIQSIRLRGDFSNQMVQIERQLVQIQELTGQGQQRLAELRQTLQTREEALRNVQATADVFDAGDPDELLDGAVAAQQRGSLSTARAGYEEFIRGFPRHPRAPEARLHMAALLEEEDEEVRALEEYSRVLELFPDAPEAATALYRAALIERDRGNSDRARSMLNQLTAAYPGSTEATAAREELRRLR
jgi:TolA-binding protein